MKSKKHFTLTISLVALILVFLSCEKIKDKINEAAEFDVNLNLADHYFSLDSNNFKSTWELNEWQTLTQYSGYVNIDSIFEAHDLSSASVENGTFTMIEVKIVNPLPGWNLNFVSAMRVKVSSTNHPNLTVVAQTGTIPANSTSVVFNLENANIATYLNDNYFTVILEGDVIGEIPTISLPMVLESGVKITVTPL